MRGKIKVIARPMGDGGTSIDYDGHMVAWGLNVVEAFITLGGILTRKGPKAVSMEMERPENPQLAADHFDRIEWHEIDRRTLKKGFGRRSASRKPARKTVARRSKRG